MVSVLSQHKTIDSVLARGEKLDSLVEKSSDLSTASQVCYITYVLTAFHTCHAQLPQLRATESMSIRPIFQYFYDNIVGVSDEPLLLENIISN